MTLGRKRTASGQLQQEEIRTLAVFKLLFALMSGLSLIFVVVGAVLPALNSEPPNWYSFGLGFTALYLIYCMLSCIPLLKARALIVSGIFMHIGLFAIAAIGIAKAGTGSLFFVIVCAGFALMWTILCVARVKTES